MHTASYEFLMKPKESAGCHQTPSSRVESGDETRGTEEGGRDHVIAATNSHSKIKKHGYKVNKRLYGQSSDGRNRRARCSTKLNMSGN